MSIIHVLKQNNFKQWFCFYPRCVKPSHLSLLGVSNLHIFLSSVCQTFTYFSLYKVLDSQLKHFHHLKFNKKYIFLIYYQEFSEIRNN